MCHTSQSIVDTTGTDLQMYLSQVLTIVPLSHNTAGDSNVQFSENLSPYLIADFIVWRVEDQRNDFMKC